MGLASRTFVDDCRAGSFFIIDVENKELGGCEGRVVLLEDNGVALRGPRRVEIQEVGVTGEPFESVSIGADHPDLRVGEKTAAATAERIVGVEGNSVAVGRPVR